MNNSLFQEQFYYCENGSVYGPFSVYELVYLGIEEESLVSVGNYHHFMSAKNIPDLLLVLRDLRVNAENDLQGLTPEDLKLIIDEQEEELLELERRNQELEQQQANPSESEAPVSDSDFRETMTQLRGLMSQLRELGNGDSHLYTKVFPSKSAEQDYYLEEYERCAGVFTDVLEQVEDKTKILSNYADKKRVYEAREYLLREINNSLYRFNVYYNRLFSESLNTAEQGNSLWDDISSADRPLSAPIYIGSKSSAVFDVLGEVIPFKQRKFIRLYDNENLIVRYDDKSRRQGVDFVNAIVARSLASFGSGLLKLTMIDAEDMSGTSDVLKGLSRDVFAIYSRPETIRQVLVEIERRMEMVIQNLLKSPINTLRDYNEKKENKESYHLLVIKDFPSGLNSEALYSLNKILKNGIRAGISVILMQNETLVAGSEDMLKMTHQLACYPKTEIDLTIDDQDEGVLGQSEFESFPDALLQRVVGAVNAGFDVKQDAVYSLSDFVMPESQWWHRRSEHQMEIPFGLTPEKQIVQLKITQESGQNSAVVIGIPGSGKSVFLHTMILNAAVNYSPRELKMYLIDFSGVEFNVYARHRLPHARVIAPEAEREFGLSILKELAEEGRRRMDLCRQNDVSSITELRQACPHESVPRLLVVIDEFQKLFEIDNDAISREANRIIHMIIQEYRKFGINLVLATQRLPSSSVLPKDLIANRVVFRSSPGDFSQLISLQSGERLPQLATGECIYNAESGSPYDNTLVKTFYTPRRFMDVLLEQLVVLAEKKGMGNSGLRVFSSSDLPDFRNRMVEQAHRQVGSILDEVGVYLGESIAIQDYDVCARLRKESNNNLLIIGGEPEVAEGIAIHASLSVTTVHEDRSAVFAFFCFMRQTDRLSPMVRDLFAKMPFDSVFANRQDEVLEALQNVKSMIDERKADEEQPQSHVYLSFTAFQLARMFDMGGRRGDDPSECGALLAYILKNGPSVGVFTIMQVDNLANLQRLGQVLPLFEHRVVLQMDEMESTKLMGTSAASKLFDINRPSSRFRAYYYAKSLNVTIKFKPYKI